MPVCRALLVPCLCLACALCLVFSDVMWDVIWLAASFDKEGWNTLRGVGLDKALQVLLAKNFTEDLLLVVVITYNTLPITSCLHDGMLPARQVHRNRYLGHGLALTRKGIKSKQPQKCLFAILNFTIHALHLF